jgi:hypothetical protein
MSGHIEAEGEKLDKSGVNTGIGVMRGVRKPIEQGAAVIDIARVKRGKDIGGTGDGGR